MTRLIAALWRDDRGYVVSAELVLVGTVAGLGLTTGLVSVREALLEEMTELEGAFRSLDQSYGYRGIRGHHGGEGLTAWTAGSSYGEGPELEPLVLGPAGQSAPLPPVAGEQTAADWDLVPPPPPLPGVPLEQTPGPLLPGPAIPSRCWDPPGRTAPFFPGQQFPGGVEAFPPFPLLPGAVPASPLAPPLVAPGVVAGPPFVHRQRLHWRSKVPPLPYGTSIPFVW